jgi:hypothetical protein
MRRRTVWAGTVAIGLSCLLVAAPTQAVGSSDGSTASRSGERTERKSATIVPLSADIRISRSAVDANGQRQIERESNRLYRDSQGRTREEVGSVVTISDPSTRTVLRLDTKSRTFQRSTGKPAPSAQGPRQSGTSGGEQVATPPRSLGTAQVNGVEAKGQAYTVTTPAVKSRPAQKKEVILWQSEQVQLTVQTRVSDTSGYEYTESYTNIRAGVEPATDLFKAPAGYREASPATAQASAAAACPVFNQPDPLVLNSFDWVYLDSGIINATSDPQLGCLFVASAWAFQYPLAGFATVDLGLPFDQWFIYDTGGGGLPFLPWTAIGDVVFVAANLTDTTTKDSIIILTVWPI